jgi:hypothetical protein
MPGDQLREYRDALASLKKSEEEAAAVVARVRQALEAAGLRSAALDRWQKVVPFNNGATFEDGDRLALNPAYARLDVTGWPLPEELVTALGKWHTARTTLENAWDLIPPAERRKGPAFPPPPT